LACQIAGEAVCPKGVEIFRFGKPGFDFLQIGCGGGRIVSVSRGVALSGGAVAKALGSEIEVAG